jgi:hypothetical protein
MHGPCPMSSNIIIHNTVQGFDNSKSETERGGGWAACLILRLTRRELGRLAEDKPLCAGGR